MIDLVNFNELIHTYVFGPGTETTVNTSSFVNSWSEVKKEIIEQTAETTKMYFEYPKGFKIYTEAKADEVVYKTNFPLKEVSTGQFEVVFPQE